MASPLDLSCPASAPEGTALLAALSRERIARRAGSGAAQRSSRDHPHGFVDARRPRRAQPAAGRGAGIAAGRARSLAGATRQPALARRAGPHAGRPCAAGRQWRFRHPAAPACVERGTGRAGRPRRPLAADRGDRTRRHGQRLARPAGRRRVRPRGGAEAAAPLAQRRHRAGRAAGRRAAHRRTAGAPAHRAPVRRRHRCAGPALPGDGACHRPAHPPARQAAAAGRGRHAGAAGAGRACRGACACTRRHPP